MRTEIITKLLKLYRIGGIDAVNKFQADHVNEARRLGINTGRENLRPIPADEIEVVVRVANQSFRIDETEANDLATAMADLDERTLLAADLLDAHIAMHSEEQNTSSITGKLSRERGQSS